LEEDQLSIGGNVRRGHLGAGTAEGEGVWILTMRHLLSIFCGLLVVVGAPAQPAAFEWDAPVSLQFVTGYRVQWGPQQSGVVPLHLTQFTVEDMPEGALLPVSVVSLSATTNSEPDIIHIFNLNVIVQESETVDGPATDIASVRIMGPRKPTSFLRLRLEGSR